MRTSKKSNNVMRDVLAFLLRHWRREAWLVTGVAVSMMTATIADLFMPVFAGRMVDAIAIHSGTHRQALHAALTALATMLLLGAVLVTGRHLSLMGISRLTIRLMTRIAGDAFYCVQRFSTDWHANNFAGSIVRRVTRGMWAVDLMDDTLLLALLPASIVLAGSGAAAGLALAVHGPHRRHGRGTLRAAFDHPVAQLCVPRGAAIERARHAGRRLPGGFHHLQRGGEVLRRRGA